MSLEFPEDMNEVEQKLAISQIKNPDMQMDQVIVDSVMDHFQAFLDESEEGHYDTGKLVGNEIVITSVAGREVARLQPIGEDFISDFKNNSDQILTYLEEQAYLIARK